jgi:hypothetical protein
MYLFRDGLGSKGLYDILYKKKIQRPLQTRSEKGLVDLMIIVECFFEGFSANNSERNLKNQYLGLDF